MSNSNMPAYAQLRLFRDPQIPNPALSWYSQRVKSYKGNLQELRRLIPTFSRRDFDLSGLANPRADIIVRNPAEKGGPSVPVAMVSKGYVLYQYTEIWDMLVEALKKEKSGPESLCGELLLSEYGERMYLRFIVPDQQFNPGDGNLLYLQVHCFNSVDKSVALQIRLGWYRDICMNGLFFGKEVGQIRRFHHSFQTPMDIPTVFAAQVKQIPREQEKIRKWYAQKISEQALAVWVDGLLTEKLGVHTAAKVLHIARTGCDCWVEQSNKRIPAREYIVHKTGAIRGMAERAGTLFDVIQILSYIARDFNNIQDQIETMNAIPDLLKPFLASM